VLKNNCAIEDLGEYVDPKQPNGSNFIAGKTVWPNFLFLQKVNMRKHYEMDHQNVGKPPSFCRQLRKLHNIDYDQLPDNKYHPKERASKIRGMLRQEASYRWRQNITDYRKKAELKFPYRPLSFADFTVPFTFVWKIGLEICEISDGLPVNEDSFLDEFRR